MSDDDAIIRQRIAGRSVREIARARCAMATFRGSIIWNAKVCRPSRSETPACFCRPSAATIVLSCLVDLSDLSGLVNHVAISNAVASAAGGELGGGFGTLNLTSLPLHHERPAAIMKWPPGFSSIATLNTARP